MKYLLGVDAGNTKTIALLAGLDGRIHGVGRAGCGDIYGVTPSEAALLEIERAVQAALELAGARPEQVEQGAFSLAGADWPEDFAFLHAEMKRRGFGRKVVVVNDAIGALYAGSPDATGVVVACGTGAAVGARTAEGRVWHSSFWQQPQGARELAQKALWAVYRAELGIDSPTGLTEVALRYFAVDTVEDLLHLLTARHRPAHLHVAGFARVLLDAAARRDPIARGIVLRHGEALGDYALAAARRVGIEGGAFNLVLSGGVLRHPSRLLAEAIVECVRQSSPGVVPIASRWQPAAGALLIAFEALGAARDERLLANLESTMPQGSVFST